MEIKTLPVTIYISFLDVFFYVIVFLSPKKEVLRLYKQIVRLYQKEAILAYYSDPQDIGFFELFILGNHKNAIAGEKNIFNIKKNLFVPCYCKLSTMDVLSHHQNLQKEKSFPIDIYQKKNKVVKLLYKQHKIIFYLKKRIVFRNRFFYRRIESLYKKFLKLHKTT